MRKKQILKPKQRGRVAQPSYMSREEFRRHCVFLGLTSDAKIAAFFKVSITTVFHWRHGRHPIAASTAILLSIMVGYGISAKDAHRFLDE